MNTAQKLVKTAVVAAVVKTTATPSTAVPVGSNNSIRWPLRA